MEYKTVLDKTTGAITKVPVNQVVNLPVPAVRTFIPDLSDDELRKLAREKLSEALQMIDPAEQPGMTMVLCAEVKDRLDGKPSQSVNVDATLRTITVNATIEIMQAPAIEGRNTSIIENLTPING